jgi:hypothetical protein
MIAPDIMITPDMITPDMITPDMFATDMIATDMITSDMVATDMTTRQEEQDSQKIHANTGFKLHTLLKQGSSNAFLGAGCLSNNHKQCCTSHAARLGAVAQTA